MEIKTSQLIANIVSSFGKNKISYNYETEILTVCNGGNIDEVKKEVEMLESLFPDEKNIDENCGFAICPLKEDYSPDVVIGVAAHVVYNYKNKLQFKNNKYLDFPKCKLLCDIIMIDVKKYGLDDTVVFLEVLVKTYKEVAAMY